MKKFFIASSVIFGVVLIFWGIYNFAFKLPPVENKADLKEEEDVTEMIPLSQDQPDDPELGLRIKDISEEGVIAPVFREESGKILFYAALDGRVFSINSDGSGKSAFATQTLSGITNVLWSPDQTKVISEFENGARRYFYDYETKSGQPLKGGLRALAWSNLGDKIFYQYNDGKTNELDMADPSGANWQKITEIRAAEAKIAPIPQTSLITFWNYPRSAEETGLLSVGMLGGEVKKIFGGKFGADYLWSPNGKKGLVSFSDVQNGSKMHLGVMDYDGGNFTDLEIPTLVSKCVWSLDGQKIFYAIPGGIPTASILPDDYQSKKFFTNDTFWKLDLKTGEKTRLIELEDLAKVKKGLDAEKLFLAANEKNLFFVNRSDGHLFRLSLSEKKPAESQKKPE